MKAIHANVGTRVFWNDPDNGECSGPGKIIVGINPIRRGEADEDDQAVTIERDSGGELDCPLSELDLLSSNLENKNETN